MASPAFSALREHTWHLPSLTSLSWREARVANLPRIAAPGLRALEAAAVDFTALPRLMEEFPVLERLENSSDRTRTDDGDDADDDVTSLAAAIEKGRRKKRRQWHRTLSACLLLPPVGGPGPAVPAPVALAMANAFAALARLSLCLLPSDRGLCRLLVERLPRLEELRVSGPLPEWTLTAAAKKEKGKSESDKKKQDGKACAILAPEQLCTAAALRVMEFRSFHPGADFFRGLALPVLTDLSVINVFPLREKEDVEEGAIDLSALLPAAPRLERLGLKRIPIACTSPLPPAAREEAGERKSSSSKKKEKQGKRLQWLALEEVDCSWEAFAAALSLCPRLTELSVSHAVVEDSEETEDGVAAKGVPGTGPLMTLLPLLPCAATLARLYISGTMDTAGAAPFLAALPALPCTDSLKLELYGTEADDAAIGEIREFLDESPVMEGRKVQLSVLE